MPWTGGYLFTGNTEGAVIPTGLLALPDNERSGVFVATATVTGFDCTPKPPNGSVAVKWSAICNTRWRRQWIWNGSAFVPDTVEELVLVVKVTPVDVHDSISIVTATQIRWSVWRLT